MVTLAVKIDPGTWYSLSTLRVMGLDGDALVAGIEAGEGCPPGGVPWAFIQGAGIEASEGCPPGGVPWAFIQGAGIEVRSDQ